MGAITTLADGHGWLDSNRPSPWIPRLPLICRQSPWIPRHLPIPRQPLVEDLRYQESPSLHSATKHVAIVMDALKEFSPEPLLWALTHVLRPGYNVTLLGVMPWLNLPLSCKTWLDVWTVNFDALKALDEMNECRSGKYQKVRSIIELCHDHGVVPHMKVVMGYPLRLVVLEQTTNLHATWVVFDRHHRKNRRYYAKRMHCNVVMMNNEREADMLKMRPMIEHGETPQPGESPMPFPPGTIIIAEDLKKALRDKCERINDKGGTLSGVYNVSRM